ncbi:MAG: hypothetical protein ABIA04_07325 [Pseudomonadota bacterium]
MKYYKKLIKSKKGQTAVEYALATILGSIIAISMYFLVDLKLEGSTNNRNILEMYFGNMEHVVCRPYP